MISKRIFLSAESAEDDTVSRQIFKGISDITEKVDDTCMKNSNISIFLDTLLWFAFFIVIGSACFQFHYKYPVLLTVYSILSKVMFILSLFLHITQCLKYKRHLVSQFDFFLLLFFIWLVFSSIINGHSWLIQVPFIMKTLTIRYLFSLYVPKNSEKATKILSSVFSFIIYANFFQLLFFPLIMGSIGGDSIYLIATNYNQFGAVFMPAIYVKMVESIQTGRKSKLISLLVICLASVAIKGSVTAIVAIFLLLTTVLFIKNTYLLKIENVLLMVGIIFFFFTFVVPTFSILNIPLVNNLVEGLGKDMTFSSRTNIWIYAEYQILHSPIIGYGVCDKEWFQHLLSNAVNTHNIILQMLLQGGVIGFLIFTMLVYVGVKKILLIQSQYEKQLLLSVGIVFLLMSQFEVYTNTFIYIFIFLMFISKDILTQKSLYYD